jgi:hypothetical protein
VQIFSDINDFLDRNLTDVVILDLEDYVQPKDVKRALIDSGLWDRVYTLDRAKPMPSLLDLVVPKRKKDPERQRRVILMSEKHPGGPKWLPGTYEISQETPFTFTAIDQFSCAPKRGKTGKPFFIVNHWLRPNGPPDPVQGGKVNSTKTLLGRLQQCAGERGAIPSAIAVDFTSIGDLHGAVAQFNAAITKVAGVTPTIDKALRFLRNHEDLTDAELREINGYKRLPKISDARARQLLGPVAATITRPADLSQLVQLSDEAAAAIDNEDGAPTSPTDAPDASP